MFRRAGLTLAIPVALLALVRCEVAFPRQSQHDTGGIDAGGAADAGGGTAGSATGGIGGKGTGGTGGSSAGGTGGSSAGGTGGSSAGGTGGSSTGGTGASNAGGTGGSGGTASDPCQGQCSGLHTFCDSTGVCRCSSGYVDTDGKPNDNKATCENSSIIQSLTVTVGVQHSDCGELTYKLVGPSSPVITLVSRSGYAETADDGSGSSTGNHAQLAPGYPLTFSDAATTSAEQMGANVLGTVCASVFSVCDYHPDRGAAAGPSSLALAFAGRDSTGTWKLCVGDSVGSGTGSLQNWSMSIDTAAGTQAYQSGPISVTIPAGGYDGSLASMGCSQITVP